MAEIDDLMGALLVGVFVACVLYGITTLQVFMYIQTFPEDPSFLKFMVALVWITETVHTGLCTQFIYVYVIRHFGDHEFLATIYWNAGFIVFSGVLIQLMVHSFYIKRVWVLSKRSRFITVPLVLLVISRFGFGIGGTAVCFMFPRWSTLMEKRGPLLALSAGIGCSACIDVIVATTLIYYLARERGRWRPSNGMLTSLIVYIVNTGALTSICSILIVITFSVQKDSLIFFALIEISSKLYANAFLGSLNTRQHIRNKLSGNVQYPAIDLSSGSQCDAAPQSRIEVFQESTVVDDTLGLSSVAAAKKSQGDLV